MSQKHAFNQKQNTVFVVYLERGNMIFFFCYSATQVNPGLEHGYHNSQSVSNFTVGEMSIIKSGL